MVQTDKLRGPLARHYERCGVHFRVVGGGLISTIHLHNYLHCEFDVAECGVEFLYFDQILMVDGISQRGGISQGS